jgi:hypothetical protein
MALRVVTRECATPSSIEWRENCEIPLARRRRACIRFFRAGRQPATRNRCRPGRRQMGMKLFVTLLAILASGCSSAGKATPQHSGSAQALSARIAVPLRSMTAGSSIKGRLVVTNNTGAAIHAWGCGTLFQVALTSRTYHPDVAWPTCLQRLTIPAGVTSYRVTVSATYLSCSESQSPGTTRACPPGGGMPPLPAGKYRAKLFQSRHLVQAPPGVLVRVIAAAGSAGG